MRVLNLLKDKHALMWINFGAKESALGVATIPVTDWPEI
jgi:hypothetical protein